VRLPDELTALMADQDGLVTNDQLAAHGVSRWHRTRLVADGWLVRVAPRVHRLRGAPPTPLWRLRAGLLSLGDESCVSFESAATLHGFAGADRRVAEFTVTRRRRSVVTPFVVHTTDQLDAVDVTTRFGLATTSPARTIIDLALAGVDDVRLTSTIVGAVDAGTCTLDDVAARLAALRRPGRWGARRLDRILVSLAETARVEPVASPDAVLLRTRRSPPAPGAGGLPQVPDGVRS
jgi:predicted transcriptional regulator of viral defense system